jgi:hypothetical protein
MRRTAERTAWVSYLRVSTPDQADRELSLPAQKRAVEDFSARHDAQIAHEYTPPVRRATPPRCIARLVPHSRALVTGTSVFLVWKWFAAS